MKKWKEEQNWNIIRSRSYFLYGCDWMLSTCVQLALYTRKSSMCVLLKWTQGHLLKLENWIDYDDDVIINSDDENITIDIQRHSNWYFLNDLRNFARAVHGNLHSSLSWDDEIFFWILFQCSQRIYEFSVPFFASYVCDSVCRHTCRCMINEIIICILYFCLLFSGSRVLLPIHSHRMLFLFVCRDLDASATAIL